VSGVPIAVLGLGEAGTPIALDLVAAGADVRGYDPRVAAPAGVAGRADEADAVRDAGLVLSVNSALDAADCLRHALPALRAGTVWADLNTASPGLKLRLTEAAAGRGVAIADVALMAPVPGRGLRTPMVAAGPGAERLAAVLGGYGADVELLDGPPGAAIARKLLRSVFYKGLAAAVVEALAGARAAGCEDWLRANVAAELAGFDARTLDRLVDGTQRHARRRAEEMAAAAEQLRELGVEPRVAGAAADLLAALAAPPSPPDPPS
jgi:3-hydroxyisobutyrate dehydrogenase-like beta-hydroxyacid dehydrogenase